jgi:hypothetical protein
MFMANFFNFTMFFRLIQKLHCLNQLKYLKGDFSKVSSHFMQHFYLRGFSISPKTETSITDGYGKNFFFVTF